jgi:hypothetical protein
MSLDILHYLFYGLSENFFHGIFHGLPLGRDSLVVVVVAAPNEKGYGDS